jgi:glycosidase
MGLDDLLTSHPKVVGGMIEIFKHWITTYRIDGFRIDTTKHVNIEFWQQFVPAIEAHAKAVGIRDFFMFGEVYSGDPAVLSRYTTEGKLPAVLDFGFQGAAAAVFAASRPTNALRDLFENDDYYIKADADARLLPTFLGNHDMGRIGAMIYRNNADKSEREQLVRSALAHALMFTARGIPVVYYGDEQGFTGVEEPKPGEFAINDQTARQNMFPALVPSYQDPVINKQLGASTTPAADNFNRFHPLYRAIAQLSRLRKRHPALQRGAQIHRYSDNQENGGIYAFSRILRGENVEYSSSSTATQIRS